MGNGSTYITNQITIQILLLFKRQESEDLGVRETQRILNLNSPSTTIYHLNKLVDLGLLNKTLSNRYQITKQGQAFALIKFPIEITPQYILGKFVPKYTLMIIFMGVSIFLSLIAFIFDFRYKTAAIAINGFVTISIVLAYVINDWFSSIKSYQEFTLNRKDAD